MVYFSREEEQEANSQLCDSNLNFVVALQQFSCECQMPKIEKNSLSYFISLFHN